MIKKSTGGIVNWLIHMNAIQAEDRDLYSYAVYQFFITICPLFLTSVIGILMGYFKESMILIIPFMIIRKFSGGYHANRLQICFIFSCLTLILCVILSSHMTYTLEMIIITICATISLSVHSPIEHKNRKLDKDEKNSYKKITMIASTLFVIISFTFHCFGQDTYAVCISVGILLTASLQLPCILKQLL